MRTRLILFALLFLILCGFTYWFDGGGWQLVGYVAVPVSLVVGLAILLPRKPAIIWCGLIATGAAILTAMSIHSSSSCNGDGCIGYFLFTFFVGGPIVVGASIIAAIRYFAKGPVSTAGSAE
jgi:hypothetical protein